MHDLQNPWRWPLAMGLVATLLWVVVFVIPSPWFALLFHINQKDIDSQDTVAKGWLFLQPPPVIMVDYEPEIIKPDEPAALDPEPFRPQDWWHRSASILVMENEGTGRTHSTPQDSASYFLHRLGLADDFMTRTQPDSVLAAKIFFLQLEDSFDFSEAKPYLSAMGRAADYEDIKSRAAAMYNEFLETKIMVPD
jgi:hypothetical protein